MVVVFPDAVAVVMRYVREVTGLPVSDQFGSAPVPGVVVRRTAGSRPNRVTELPILTVSFVYTPDMPSEEVHRLSSLIAGSVVEMGGSDFPTDEAGGTAFVRRVRLMAGPYDTTHEPSGNPMTQFTAQLNLKGEYLI